MTVRIESREKDGVLWLKGKGICDDLASFEAFARLVQGAALPSGLTRLLVDESEVKYALDTLGVFKSGELVAEKTPANFRVAVVYAPGEQADAKFWETVAVNRGVRVRTFEDPTAAEAWLRAPGGGATTDSSGD
jgi:hypothetical protein